MQCPFGRKRINKEVKNNKLNQVGGYPPTTKVAGFPASSIMKFRKEKINNNCEEFWKIIDDCINSFDTLIHLMAVGDPNALCEYVDTI